MKRLLSFEHMAHISCFTQIAKRIDYRMRQMEKELEAREKALKNKRPPNVVAALKAIDAIKEMDKWDASACEALMQGKEPTSLNDLSLEGEFFLSMLLVDDHFCILFLHQFIFFSCVSSDGNERAIERARLSIVQASRN
jgi:hypothetical protein